MDYFLQSLAADQGNRAIGVILSGTASDGVKGMKDIKEAGGITFAQDDKTAKYTGMPQSAVAAGCVDYVLPPGRIAEELARLASHPFGRPAAAPQVPEIRLEEEGTEFSRILALLKVETGVDFTHYKPSTIKRRILRGMALDRVESLADYAKYLAAHRPEVKKLYEDILINVTGFFREPEAFEALKNLVFPAITRDRSPDDPIRIWVPGCASGEEAYSIAISLLEFLGDRSANFQVQVFATDIDDRVIGQARAGVYPEAAVADVSPERLRRFFVKGPGGYQVSKTIRDICVFARQNLIKDPPFSHLDLVSCRNVLIYFGPVLQQKVIPIFHFALKPNGFLLLGKSEALGAFMDMFALVDKRYKIYSHKALGAPQVAPVFPLDHPPPPPERRGGGGEDQRYRPRRAGPAPGGGPPRPGPLCPGGSHHRRNDEDSAFSGTDRRFPRAGPGGGQPQPPEDGPGRPEPGDQGRGAGRHQGEFPGAQGRGAPAGGWRGAAPQSGSRAYLADRRGAQVLPGAV